MEAILYCMQFYMLRPSLFVVAIDYLSYV
jgi:hypothetical protein